MAEIRTDINSYLEFKEDTIRAREGSLLVDGSNGRNLSLDAKEIAASWIEEGLGACILVVRTKAGREIDVAYFTRRKLNQFRKFSAYINKYARSGKFPEEQFETPARVQHGSIGTLKWLYGFTAQYRRSLYLGSALALLSVLLGLVPPYLLKVLIDSVILAQSHPTSLFEELTIVLVASYTLLTFTGALQNYYLNLAGNKIVTEMRSKLFAHAIKLPAAAIDGMTTSRILTRLTSDVGNTQWLMTFGLTSLLTNVFTIAGIGIILFSMYPPLAVYVLIPIPFIVATVVHYKKRSDKMYHKNYRSSADMYSKIDDTIPNYLIVKATSNEEFESKRFSEVLERYYGSQMDVVALNNWHWPLVGLFTTMATVMIWWVGGGLVINGAIQLGIITAFISYLSMFYSPIAQLGNIIPFVQSSITSGDRLRELSEVETQSSNSKGKRPGLYDDVVFDNVSFGYEGLVSALQNVNVRIKKGEKTAIVGKSGSGKTTMARLLLRIYEISDGSIRVGGSNINDIDIDYLRRRIAYVPQEVFFFDDTAKYNVGYYQHSRSDLDIIAACKAASMHDELMRLPFAYDSNIGYNGSRLSGGQRQRLSIARAMLARPDIVILDEVTSNLDAISAREVDKAIINLTTGKTTIWITHHADEVMGSNNAILLDRGKVVESGPPLELMRKKGRLYHMYRNTNWKDAQRGRKRARFTELQDYLAGLLVNTKRIKIREGARPSVINATLHGRRLEGLIPKRPFPITSPWFVILNDKYEDGVAVLEDYRKLDAHSRKVVEDALRLRSFSAEVTAVKGINITGDGLEWTLATSGGELKVVTRRRRHVMRQGNDLVLMDEYGTPYTIHMKKLDPESLEIVNNTI